MGDPPNRYYRVESDLVAASGDRLGVFGRLRDLRHDGSLDADDEAMAAEFVARAYRWHAAPPAAAYPPGALSWFVADASSTDADELRALVTEIVRFLRRHGIQTRVRWTDDPGDLTYVDAVQVVAVSEHRRDVSDLPGTRHTLGRP